LRPEGVGPSGIHPIPGEESLKQARLSHIKTRAGRAAYLVLHGSDSAPERVLSGISKAEGALKWISRVLKERSSE